MGGLAILVVRKARAKATGTSEKANANPRSRTSPLYKLKYPAMEPRGCVSQPELKNHYHQVQLVGEGPLELVHGVCTWMMVIMNEFPELGALLAMQLQLLMCCRVYGGSGWRNMG